MARTLLTSFFAILAVLLAVYYQVSLKAILSANGIWRAIEPVGNTNCKKVEALQACESASRRPKVLFQLAEALLQRSYYILLPVFSTLLAPLGPAAGTGFQL